MDLLPHENEKLKSACIIVDNFLEIAVKVNQTATTQIKNASGIARHFLLVAMRDAQWRKSHIPNEVSHTAFEDFRNLGKGFKGNLLFRPFDVANVISRQIGLFRQLLLAQTRLLPPGADGFPQNAINSARRCLHSCP